METIMAHKDVEISDQMQLSLCDLSMELESLGLRATFRKDSCPIELCETLLSTTWTLINYVHRSSMGLNEKCKSTCDKELLTQSEKQVLEDKLEHVRNELKARDNMILKEKGIVFKLENELKVQNQAAGKHKKMIAHLTATLENQEKDFKHSMARQEAENEHLKELVRKSLGVGLRSHIYVEKLEDAFESLTATDRLSSEHKELEEVTLNRLKSNIHTLVGENLMLRDALKYIHSDINIILNSVHMEASEMDIPGQSLEDNVFRLPLSYCMNKIKEIRMDQIMQLNKIIKSKC